MRILSLVATCLFCVLSVAASGEKIGARVVYLEGKARSEKKLLKAGDLVPVGATIQTARNSKMKLLMADRSIVDIGPATEFVVVDSSAPPKGTEINLEFGTLRASIKKDQKDTKFRVRTKSSVLSARGTEFFVRSRPQGQSGQVIDQVTVASGVVEMAIPGGLPMMLEAGKQVTALAKLVNNELRVDPRSGVTQVDLPAEKVHETARSVTVADQTFQQAVVISEKSPATGGPSMNQGAATLPAAAEEAARAPGLRGPASTASGDEASRPRPPALRPPPPMPSTIGMVDGSKAETITQTGVNVRVVFQLE